MTGGEGGGGLFYSGMNDVSLCACVCVCEWTRAAIVCVHRRGIIDVSSVIVLGGIIGGRGVLRENFVRSCSIIPRLFLGFSWYKACKFLLFT